MGVSIDSSIWTNLTYVRKMYSVNNIEMTMYTVRNPELIRQIVNIISWIHYLRRNVYLILFHVGAFPHGFKFVCYVYWKLYLSENEGW